MGFAALNPSNRLEGRAMSTRWKVLLALAILPTAIASLYLYERIRVQFFYAGRPVLSEMAAIHDGVWSDDSTPVRQTLLQRFPIGTTKDSITAALSKEGFGCEQRHDGVRAVPADVVRRKEEYVDCQLLVEEILGSRRWIIDLWFDDDDHLRGARAAIWNIFL
jgi:hypothetical protein